MLKGFKTQTLKARSSCCTVLLSRVSVVAEVEFSARQRNSDSDSVVEPCPISALGLVLATVL